MDKEEEQQFEIYKKQAQVFRAVLEGLEVRNIDSLGEKTPEFGRSLGKEMTDKLILIIQERDFLLSLISSKVTIETKDTSVPLSSPEESC